MSLKEFIERFVCRNTVIRLWLPVKGGHKIICESNNENDKGICMEWELLKGYVWQSKYSNYKVIGVTDIITDTYREAVNIVIQDESIDDEISKHLVIRRKGE